MASSNPQLDIFSQLSLIGLQIPRPSPIGIRHEVLALAHEITQQSAIAGRVGLTLATVNRILQRHAATGTLVPASLWGLHRRPHLVKTVFCSEWSDRIASCVLGSWWRRWGICMEWVLARKPITTTLAPWLPCLYTNKVAPVDCQPPTLGVGREVTEPANGPLAACHLQRRVQIPTLPGRWQAHGKSFTWRALPAKVPSLWGPSWLWFATPLRNFS